MHVCPPGALGPHQAIVVAWGVDGWQLGVSVHMCHQQHLNSHGLGAGLPRGPFFLHGGTRLVIFHNKIQKLPTTMPTHCGGGLVVSATGLRDRQEGRRGFEPRWV